MSLWEAGILEITLADILVAVIYCWRRSIIYIIGSSLVMLNANIKTGLNTKLLSNPLGAVSRFNYPRSVIGVKLVFEKRGLVGKLNVG